MEKEQPGGSANVNPLLTTLLGHAPASVPAAGGTSASRRRRQASSTYDRVTRSIGLVVALLLMAALWLTGGYFTLQWFASLGVRVAAAGLRARELISSAYLEREVTVDLTEGGQVQALAYVIDPDHVQYCGGLPLEEQAQIIARAVGGRGPNRDYLFATARHLAELGIADADLEWLANRVAML